MAQYPQSWLHSTFHVWLGYVLTAVAALPAAAFGFFLIGRGVGKEAAFLISVSFALVGGFVLEAAVRPWSSKKIRIQTVPSQFGYQFRSSITAVSAAGFVYIVTASIQPNAAGTSIERTTAASASLVVRAS
jgi:hypothetical protein